MMPINRNCIVPNSLPRTKLQNNIQISGIKENVMAQPSGGTIVEEINEKKIVMQKGIYFI